MNTLFDLFEFNRERASRHIANSDRGWWVAGARRYGLRAVRGLRGIASATPSTTFWAPSTASCQAAGVPHITYDTYFGKGPAAGSQGAPNYPIDTGLTIGLIPSNKVQAEAGFDALLPSQDPLFLNAKLCTPESSLSKAHRRSAAASTVSARRRTSPTTTCCISWRRSRCRSAATSRRASITD